MWTGKLDTSSGHYIYYNGVQEASNTTKTTLTVNSNGIVGAGYSGTAPFNGDLGEILIYSSTLSDANRVAIGNYLMTKWMTGNSNLLPITTTLTVAGGATFDLSGCSQQVASLSDYNTPGNGGSVINSIAGTTPTLTLSPTGTSTTFSGAISGGGTLGTINLVMNGNGVQVLAGTNTYTGPTTITAGTLAIGGAGYLGSGGNYASSITNSGALVVNTSSNQTFGGIISGGGTFYQNGSGMTTLTAANNYSGATTVSGGTLAFSPPSGSAWSLTGSKSVASGATLNLNLAGQADATQNTIGTIAVNGTWNVGSTTAGNDGSVFNGMILSGGGTINVNGPDEVEFGSWTVANNDLTGFSGVLNVTSGTFGLNNQYTGSLGANTLGSANLDFRLAAGTTFDMRYGNWVANLLSGSGTITSNYTVTDGLYVGRGNGSSTFAGVIKNGSGTLTLTKEGSGALTLTGVNTYSGPTAISGGTLMIGGSGMLGGGNYSNSISNSGAFVLNTSANQTLGGIISGPGAFYQNGSGTTTLVANNLYSGATNVNAGTLLLNSGTIAAASPVTVANLAAFGGSGSAGTVAVNAGGIIQGGINGAGTLNLSALTFNGSGARSISRRPPPPRRASPSSGMLTTGITENVNITNASPLTHRQHLCLVDVRHDRRQRHGRVCDGHGAGTAASRITRPQRIRSSSAAARH